ncbi:MFS transporter [Heliobacterium gestii]|uniref:MFS transporter n=1 Tax=Heliomicrobium gestii TaxID=2699 RepID=A0A845LCT2_HELGE|nr:MFS transporter [Heliomicrobium gestii]MBM7868343.1 FSR family fosmidomycin resistance protein-like MFS transporter [Heliomicrobium gestii]MZP42449.1 MFS transporter [Heliomicrobium gestii]
MNLSWRSIWQNRKLLLLSLGHLVTDLNQGAMALVAIFLKDRYDLSYFLVGIAILVGNVSSSVIQPLFGVLSDRYRTTWLMPLGTVLAGAGMALAGLSTSFWIALLGFLLSGLGVAAFHPESYKAAQVVAGKGKASAISIFSVGGNLGFGIGPLLAGYFYKWWGLPGLVGFLPITVLMAYMLIQSLASLHESSGAKASPPTVALSEPPVAASVATPFVFTGPLVTLLIIVFLRSWVTAGLTTYVPLYFVDILHGTKDQGANLLSYFLIVGAIGTLLGGPIADRFGARRLIFLSMLISMPLVFLVPFSNGLALQAILALLGIVLFSSFSSAIVIGQEMMPNHLGTVSGLIIGFAIGMGGVGVTVLGKVADQIGIVPIFTVLAVLLFIGAGLTMYMALHWRKKEGAALS